MTGATTTYAWDYRNHLTSLTNATGTATFAYDPSDERIQLVSGGATTNYPFPFYNVASSTGLAITKHLFIGDQPIADIQGTGSSSQTYRQKKVIKKFTMCLKHFHIPELYSRR